MDTGEERPLCFLFAVVRPWGGNRSNRCDTREVPETGAPTALPHGNEAVEYFSKQEKERSVCLCIVAHKIEKDVLKFHAEV